MLFRPIPHAGHAGWCLPFVLLASLAGGLAGCHAHDHADAAHADEEPAVAVTVWSEHHEVFAEYTVPVVGNPSHFATHVSTLADGQPRRAGGVTYRLRSSNGRAFDVVDDSPARDGIYVTDVTYPEAGEWSLTLDIGAGADVDPVDLGTVAVYETDAARDAAPEAEEADGIGYLKEQQWVFGTLTARVERRTLQEWIAAPGTIHAAPSHRAEVVPPLAGRLAAPGDGTLPALGQRVEEGEVLAWIQPPLMGVLVDAVAADADLARAEVALQRAQVEHERTELLHGQQARSDRELQESEFVLRDALVARDGARRVVEAYAVAGIAASADGPPRFAVPAPIAGVVDELLAVEGQYVLPDQPILRLIETDHVHVETQVLAEDLDAIDPDRLPRLVMRTRDGPRHVDLPGNGRLLHVGREVDSSHGRAPVDYEFDNPEGRLRPGTPVEVHLPTAHGEQVLAVPTSALIRDEGLTVVFVQLGGESFERRPVTTGLKDGGWTEVSSGLAEGERVVSTGAYAVRLASVASGAPAHGHAH